MEKSLSTALEKTFNLNLANLYHILNLALSQGGDFSEIYLEHSIYSYINMEDDIIKETAENISQGLGIRVISGEKTGFGYTNSFSLNKVRKVAQTAASIANHTKSISISQLIPLQMQHNFYPIQIPAHETTIKTKISLVKKTYSAAQGFSRYIKKVKVNLVDKLQTVIIANSEGTVTFDSRPLLKLTCTAIAEKSGKREAGYYGGGGRVGLEYFSKQLTPQTIGQEASKEALLLLKAVPPPAGEMPVVLAPGHSGVLIHEAVGHLLEADFNRKKTSIFWDKLGKKVASYQLTIYDDPTIPHFRGSYNIDDEGTIPQKTLLIDRGKVVGFLQDKLSAKLMKASLTGHGRRQNFTHFPIPRMSNTYIGPGEFSPQEIIKSVSRGFYAYKYQGGQVEDSGKFTFSVSSGFLIEEGKLTSPVKQATLIGTNIDILNKISMVGSDLKFGLQTGTCSKSGQQVPVNDGCPTLKIDKMTVGGLE